MARVKETAGRIGWFVGLWVAGVVSLSVVAYVIRLMIK